MPALAQGTGAGRCGYSARDALPGLNDPWSGAGLGVGEDAPVHAQLTPLMTLWRCSDGRHHSGPFLKVLGRLGHDDAKFANHDAVDHRRAIAEKIHPVLHANARENVPRTQLQRVLPVKRVAVRVSDGGPDHVGREGRESMLVDPPDSPDPLLRVPILEREILSDNDVVPVAASHEIRAKTTLRTSSTRFKDAPRPYRTLEEFVRFEPRNGRRKGLRLKSAAPAQENAETDDGGEKERLDAKLSDHAPDDCTKSSTHTQERAPSTWSTSR